MRWCAPALAATTLLAAGVARAQRAEVRVDAFASRSPGAQLGAGVAFDAGTYVRVAVIGAAGGERRPGGAITGVQRVELVGRFQLDPFRQARRGAYVGGGVAARHAVGGPVRPALVAIVGVEGAPRGTLVTAIEAGVGGGARLGVVLRRTRRDRR